MLNNLMKNKYIFFDGAMGTQLMKNGMKPGMRSDLMNIQHPEVVERIHRAYVDAGSQIICSNSFSSCSETLKEFDLSARQVITAAIDIAKRASGERALVALDIGPTGEFMSPYGDLTFQRAYDRFYEQCTIGKAAGADLAAIETMADISEIDAAIKAAEKAGIDIFATMTFNADGRTYTGCPVEDFASYINDTPVLAAGINCSHSPAEMYETAEKLASLLKKPLIIKLNAGLPNGVCGEYSVTPEMFAEQMMRYKDINVKIIGGCCGTTPEYIKALKAVFC